MDRALIVRGRYIGRTFIPDGPLPDAEGPAELIIKPTRPAGERDDEPAAPGGSTEASDIFAEMRPYMVDVPDVDDSRESIYSPREGK